jgi:AcrR family transcriptional regulator
VTQPPIDQSGRRLGPRAAETRRRLLDATEDLLAERSLRELRVIDVARRVGTSAATFYQYFGDLEDAVVQLAERAAEEMPPIVAEIGAGFVGEAGLARARRIVDAFIDHWDRHRSVLRVRNLASEEGDARFRTVRAHTHRPIIEALAERVREAQARGGAAGLHPYAAAAAIAAILERLAAYHEELRAFEVERDDLVESSARILQRTLGGDA